MSSDNDIGLIIKKQRGELTLSIRELARRTGLSASFISQLEHGKTKASLDSLRLISKQLAIPMASFFLETNPLKQLADIHEQECPPDQEQDEFSPVVRAGCRPRLYFPESRVSYELLMTELNRKMEAIFGRISPGEGNIARRLRKPTEEFVFVISGSLRLIINEHEYILTPGDSIYFSGENLKELRCASDDEDATWISVITPPVF